jgi:carbamoyl-phosphate synthase large subunit
LGKSREGRFFSEKTSKMNVLLTSVGRRNYLIDYFKEAVFPMGGKIFAVNSHENSPALYRADNYRISPLIHSDEYIPFLLRYCKDEDVRIVVPLLDSDLPVLSSAKNLFEAQGIYVLVPDEWLTRLANDKLKTYEFLKEKGFNTVPTFSNFEGLQGNNYPGIGGFPWVVKPRWGMGSLSVYQADDEEELKFYHKIVRKEVLESFLKYESNQDCGNEVLIMQKIHGEEFMLDIINDLSGNYILTVVNKKLLRKRGETEAVETVKNPVLEALGAIISSLTKHPLVMDVDVIVNENGPYILEFNPRFGGGYPFSHFAGINLPKALVNWLNGSEVDPAILLTPKIGTKSMKGIVIVGQQG